MNAHDLGAVRECMADSCAVEDHRRLRVAHPRGPDEHIAMLASALALAPDYLVEILRDVAVEPWGHVIVARSYGTATDGGPFESAYIALSVWNSSGLLVRLGVYEGRRRSDRAPSSPRPVLAYGRLACTNSARSAGLEPPTF